MTVTYSELQRLQGRRHLGNEAPERYCTSHCSGVGRLTPGGLKCGASKLQLTKYRVIKVKPLVKV